MKVVITFFIAALSVSAWAQTYVQPHVRKDGTYVEGHMRSSPNSSRQDNYSTQGNYNPYTGEKGTVDPYKQTPSYQAPSYGQQCGYTKAGNYICR